MPGVQRLQFFLSEPPWEAELVNDRRLELLREESATAPHDGGVMVIDDSGDRKDGTATAHVVRRWLGRYGKTDNGIVTVTTVWTDGRVYYPLHATPYTPALTAGLIAWQQSRTSDQQRHNAEAARRVAVSRQLAAQSATLIGTKPDLASLPEPHPFHPAATTGNPGPSQTRTSP
uniref:transposase n=1 Tax=Streptomyces olivochromogenes TaxID=1963 RepID=UPI001F1BA15A|nr:transposase [Streptomyces olivochromogenes]